MISVVIPIYNGIEYIDESVTSVLDQTYLEQANIDWEIVIGINGHPPNSLTYRLAKEYESTDNRIKVYDMHTVKGKSNALNAMLAYCKGEWIAMLDVDDIWMPTKLEKQVPFLQKYDVIGTKCVYFENLAGTVPQIPVGDISSFDFSVVNPVINSSCLIKKELAIKYKWNPAYDGIEDYDLWLRLRRNGAAFYNVDEVLIKHRIHSSSAYNTQDNRAKLAQALRDFKSN
jgi:teichuronic acid biosynthesis glycosyltransferase TuaG